MPHPTGRFSSGQHGLVDIVLRRPSLATVDLPYSLIMDRPNVTGRLTMRINHGPMTIFNPSRSTYTNADSRRQEQDIPS